MYKFGTFPHVSGVSGKEEGSMVAQRREQG